MNWLLIIVVLVLALSILNGYRKGFLKIIYSMVSWIVMLVLVTWLTPYVNTFFVKNTSLSSQIASYCEQSLRQKAGELQPVQPGLEVNEFLSEEIKQQITGLGVNLPESVIDRIWENAVGTTSSFLETAKIYELVAKSMAEFILNGISFFIALVTAVIVVHLVSHILNLAAKIPIIHGVNRYLGIAAGAVYGFVLVEVAFYLIAVCSAAELGRGLTAYIYENPFLISLYENNMIVTLVLLFFQ